LKPTLLITILLSLLFSCSTLTDNSKNTTALAKLSDSLPMVNTGNVMLVKQLFRIDENGKNLIIEQPIFDFDSIPSGHSQFNLIPIGEIEPSTLRVIEDGEKVGLMIDCKKNSLGFLISPELSEKRNKENTVDWFYLGGYPKSQTETLEKIKQEIFILIKQHELKKSTR